MTLSPQTEEHLRRGLRHFNRFMVLLFRLGLPRWVQFWPAVTGRILVLVHKGRKSGLVRRTPLNFAEVDGELYVTAGFGATADWYRNVRADPRVEIWLPDGWWTAEAQDVSDDAHRRDLMRAVLVGSGFAAYAFGVSPRLPDERVDELTAKYRLLRLHRTGPCTGPGGPGDLSWVWPAAALVLLTRAGHRRRR